MCDPGDESDFRGQTSPTAEASSSGERQEGVQETPLHPRPAYWLTPALLPPPQAIHTGGTHRPFLQPCSWLVPGLQEAGAVQRGCPRRAILVCGGRAVGAEAPGLSWKRGRPVAFQVPATPREPWGW